MAHALIRAGANRWLQQLENVIVSLEQDCTIFGLAPESEQHDEPVRQIVFKTKRGRPYRVLFIVREGVIYILHGRGPGQNLLTSTDIQIPE